MQKNILKRKTEDTYMQIHRQDGVMSVQPAHFVMSETPPPYKKQRFRNYPNILRHVKNKSFEDTLQSFLNENVGVDALKNFNVQEVVDEVKKYFNVLPTQKKINVLKYVTIKDRLPFTPTNLFRQWGKNIKDIYIFGFLFWLNTAIICGVMYNKTKHKEHILTYLSIYVNVEKWCVGKVIYTADFHSTSHRFMFNVNGLWKMMVNKDYKTLKKIAESVKNCSTQSDLTWIQQFVNKRLEEKFFYKLDQTGEDVEKEKLLIHTCLLNAWDSEYEAPVLRN